jgi:uncharacterized protein YndB with AHSA1/START domain
MKVTKSIQINAPIEKVWDALTNPDVVELYLFGTKVITDWKEESPILFKGNWHGKPFEDKGKVLGVQQNSQLKYSYWSSVLGLADIPENYTVTTYTLRNLGHAITVVVMQENLESQPTQVQEYAEKYWEDLLQSLKKIAEMDCVKPKL